MRVSEKGALMSDPLVRLRKAARRSLDAMNVILTVSGMVSLVAGGLALIWPGKARDVFEAYLDRFALVEQDVAEVRAAMGEVQVATGRIEADTGLLVAALPQGVALVELFRQQACPGSESASSTFLMLENTTNRWVRGVNVEVLSAYGVRILSRAAQDVAPMSAITQEWQGDEVAAVICISALTGDGILAKEGIRVTGWDRTGETCVQQGRYAGMEFFAPRLSEIYPEDAAAICP